ncbi:DUF805 domain-containing protein [Deinococcus aerophilus]|uniref:DUF805 domain-containing protein n=1 Tax=Deinococcus aerophilus TaxID=522488 RepID=A0ABQ2GR66_9DEIO|nr:DUF805 domain-containing protein [Deinococcus aerophilus]GGM07745.1 DUF805 domain-containing protein [Deinococcus aerophilus]
MNEYLKVIRHHYADFSGRARRREYWMFTLFNLIITFVLGFVDGMLGLGSDDLSLGVLSGIYTLAVLIPGLALTARRLHDTGRSGWWQLLSLIPLVGGIVVLVFVVSDSDAQTNRWGPNPKGVSGSAAFGVQG